MYLLRSDGRNDFIPNTVQKPYRDFHYISINIEHQRYNPATSIADDVYSAMLHTF